MDKNNKDLISWKFYALLTGAAAGMIGGIYYLYTLFSDNMDADISEDQKEKLEELVKLSETLNESESAPEKKQTVSNFAIKIFRQINELSEEIFLKENPNWMENRRNLIKDKKISEYNSYCENILSEKMRIESQSAEMILAKLGMSQIELQGMMEKIPQTEFMAIQQEMIQKSQASTLKKSPESFKDAELIKAFKEFIRLKNELDVESRQMAQFMNDNSEEARMHFFVKMEVNKYKIDDSLFNLFELEFSSLMMLINSRQLFTNPEISEDYQKMMQEFNQAAY